MNAVVAKDVTRRFGYTPVLRGLELIVARGEHVAITGPNGSGKTTLLRVLSGLLRTSSGTISVLAGSARDARVRRRIGVIGHAPSLYPRMTAMENLRFWAGIYGDRAATSRGSEILARLGLDPDERRPVASYSQGMRQRVSVARALSNEPDLVLADEPLAALDEEGAQLVGELLRSCPTVIAATHHADPFVGSRRLELRDGKLRPV